MTARPALPSVGEVSPLVDFGPLVEAVAAAVIAGIERRGGVAAPSAGPEPWRLLTLKQAAERLTRSPRWLREKAHSGAIPYVRLDGGAYAFDPDDVREFARARRVGDPDSVAGLVAAGRDAA